MKIEKIGLYKTVEDKLANVVYVSMDFALGFVQNKPVSWTVAGNVWTGSQEHRIVEEWPAERAVNKAGEEIRQIPLVPMIGKPGFYREAGGLRVEILAIRGSYAFGVIDDGLVGVWLTQTGYGWTPSVSKIVGPWKETRTVDLTMCREGNKVWVEKDRLVFPCQHEILARRMVTLVEGEGV